MQVLKFGGTSVANAANISKVIDIVKKTSQNTPNIVVVSALSGVTDLLLNSAKYAADGNEDYKSLIRQIEEKHFDAVKDLIPVAGQSHWLSLVKTTINEIEDICHGLYMIGELPPKVTDRISSFGEWLSSQLIAGKMKLEGIDVVWKDSRELIKTNNNYTKAQVDFAETNKNIQEFVKNNPHQVTLVPGFIASDDKGITTTLGRGGSDYTAAIYAAAIEADDLQIWTDVSGIMTADPRLANNAKPIAEVTYQEAMELSHFGAKVIYPPTIQPVMSKNIRVWIKNTFQPDDYGTLLVNEFSAENKQPVVGVTNMSKIALLTLEGSGMIGIPGFSARLFQALSHEKVNVILITQSSSEHSITVAINEEDTEKAEKAVSHSFEYEINTKKILPLQVEKDLSIVALVGENMKSRSGVSGKMFNTLGKNGVNIRAIAQGSSEKNISAVIATKDVKKAVNVLHEDFFENETKQIHLFICGVGNVGSKLIQQIYSQNDYLKKHLSLNIRVAGMSNSRKMLFNEEGINLENWEQQLTEGESSSVEAFKNKIIDLNLRNSVFVDITASADVTEIYKDLLNKSISVVACNKIAAASDYKTYSELKRAALDNNCKYYFETNVGAGLPIIGTINDLTGSGDQVTAIQAVLSGTLNFVFNEYDTTKTFAEVVKEAQEAGYTEPDPRLDLTGKDVMRKILILAREAGYPLEMDNISNTAFLPEECLEGSVEDFYKALAKYEDHFQKLYNDAKANNCKLKYVATFKDGNASVGLQHIKPESDLYHLYGKDNIVVLNTLRYSEQPLVIKGAGAGAEVTASGIFADIVKTI